MHIYNNMFYTYSIYAVYVQVHVNLHSVSGQGTLMHTRGNRRRLAVDADAARLSDARWAPAWGHAIQWIQWMMFPNVMERKPVIRQHNPSHGAETNT